MDLISQQKKNSFNNILDAIPIAKGRSAFKAQSNQGNQETNIWAGLKTWDLQFPPHIPANKLSRKSYQLVLRNFVFYFFP